LSTASAATLSLQLTGLGQVSQVLGELPDAQGFFEDSVRIWRDIGDQGSLAQTLNQLGMPLLVRQDRAVARRCFLEALGIVKEAQIAPVMLDSGRCCAGVCTRSDGSSFETLQSVWCSCATGSAVG
jgi:hypothetical protein